MTTNITSKFIQGTGVAVTTEGDTRILAIHAYSTVNGTIDIEDSKGSKIKFQVPASSQADNYIGELCIRCRGTVSVSTPGANGSIFFIVG